MSCGDVCIWLNINTLNRIRTKPHLVFLDKILKNIYLCVKKHTLCNQNFIT